MSRVVMISSDCHAGVMRSMYRDYMDEQYRAALDDYERTMLEVQGRVERAFDAEGEQNREDVAQSSRFMDSEGRLADLEDSGVVAEVLFPAPSPATSVPFSDFLSTGSYRTQPGRGRELADAGERAYNRWLAEFCRAAPGRRAGLAFIPFHDVEASVSTIEWAAAEGLRGILLPSMNYDVPEYCRVDYWEPIRSACEANDLSLNFHGGYGLPEFGDHNSLIGLEFSYFGTRAVWHLIFSGVFDRHPGLRMAVTESYALWVPETMARLDAHFEVARQGTNRKGGYYADTHLCRRRPSEYWQSNCFVGVSITSRPEMERRHDIGVDTMMYGIDYPHPEGSWGQARTWLQASLGEAGTPAGEARKILGENAARLYGFDLDMLAPIAERVGPTLEEVLSTASPEQLEALIRVADASGRELASVNLQGVPQAAATGAGQ